VTSYGYMCNDISVSRIWETKVGSERLEVTHGYIVDDLKNLSIELAWGARDEEGAPKRPLEIWTTELTKEFKI